MSRVANSASARPKRTPVGSRNILSVSGKEPGYVYRIVNDTGDRLQQFIDAGYEHVDANSVRVGDKRVNNASPEGSKAQVTVSKTGEKAFVMRIKEEWYIEDQLAKRAALTAIEDSIKRKASEEGNYGSVRIER